MSEFDKFVSMLDGMVELRDQLKRLPPSQRTDWHGAQGMALRAAWVEMIDFVVANADALKREVVHKVN